MGAAEDLDDRALLLELLREVRELRAEVRARGPRRRSAPPAPADEPVELSETDHAAARAAARRLGLVVHEDGKR